MDYKAIVDKVKNNKHTRIVIFCILLAGLLIFVNSLAKYTNRIQGSTTVKPAAFGKLTLQEYDSDGNPVAENNSETISLSSLATINKRVNLKYSKGDIKSYIFFIIKANGWNYDSAEKKVAIKGRNNDLVYIQINDNWNYLEAPDVDESTFVFYHLVDIDERFEDDVISSLRGKDLTLSIMMANGEIKSITKQFPSSNPSQSVDYYSLQISNDALLLFRYDSGGFWDVRVGLMPTANTSVSFKAIKLELGSVSTLAMDTAPNTALETLKCQRYYHIYATESLRPSNMYDCMPTMRTTPAQSTITIDGVTYYANTADL
jgi:hypothetical protein